MPRNSFGAKITAIAPGVDLTGLDMWAHGVPYAEFEPTDEEIAARRTIIDTDPPDQTSTAKIASGSFSQQAVAAYQRS